MTPPSEKPEDVLAVAVVKSWFGDTYEDHGRAKRDEARAALDALIRERDEAHAESASLAAELRTALFQRDEARAEVTHLQYELSVADYPGKSDLMRERDEARGQLEVIMQADMKDADDLIAARARIASLEGALREIADNAVTLLHCQSIARAALTGNEAPLTGDKREDSTAKPCDVPCPKGRYCTEHGALLPEDWPPTERRSADQARIASLEGALRRLYPLSDEQALIIRAALAETNACDGTCPKGRYCPEHGDLLPEELQTPPTVAVNAAATPEWCPTCGCRSRPYQCHNAWHKGPQNVEGEGTVPQQSDPTVAGEASPSTTPERCPTEYLHGSPYWTCANPWHGDEPEGRHEDELGHTETST